MYKTHEVRVQFLNGKDRDDMSGKGEKDKERSRKFVTELSQQGREFCIIGLTGRVRSGTSDVCDLLTNPNFHTRMDLPACSTDASLAEAREYRVIYRYLRENWKPFVELSVTDVIISYALEWDCAELQGAELSETGELVRNTLSSCVTEKTEDFKKLVFQQALTTDNILQHGVKTDENRAAYLEDCCETFMNKISSLDALYSMWKNVKKELEGEQINDPNYPEGSAFFFCFGVLPFLEAQVKEALKKDERYPMTFQDFGNSVRAAGSVISVLKKNSSPDIAAHNLFALPRRINQFIKILRKRRLEKSSTERFPVFVVINNFKNIFEAYYFKRRYSAFFLMAVSCDEKTRQDQFSSPSKFTLTNLREDLSSGKKIYKSAVGARCYRDLKHDETFETELRAEFQKELGLNDAELDFVREIFYSENKLRLSSYQNNLAPFILQDVVTCIENADIFVTRNSEENDYQYDHQLIRQLGRIVTLILHPGLLTPTKIERCMQIAMTAKLNSGCLSRQVGAVVTDRDYNILSLGWNDAPCGAESCLRRNFFDLARKSDPCAYSDFERKNSEFRHYVTIIHSQLSPKVTELQGLPMAFCFKDIYQTIIKQRDQIYTRALHGEERALASSDNVQTKGGYLFTTSSPCELCAKRAKEAGISKIYYIQQYPGISRSHVISIGPKGTQAKYESFVGAVGLAYIKLYTPLIPYKDELAAFNFSPKDAYDEYERAEKEKNNTRDSGTPAPVAELSESEEGIDPMEQPGQPEQPSQ